MSFILINPGSEIPEPPKDKSWTNTYEVALSIAQDWLKEMHENGLTDVVLLDPSECSFEDGRWSFYFQHTVTKKIVAFDTHGISPLTEFATASFFDPRQYWNGSSSADPCLEDFAAPEFVPVRTYRAVES